MKPRPALPPTRPYRRSIRSLRPARRRGRRATVLALILVTLLVGGAAAFGGWALWRFVTAGYVFSAPPRGPLVSVSIPSGASLSEIADILAARHVVPRAGAFESRAEADGYGVRFRPGTYTFHQYETYSVIVARLAAGGVSSTITVTFPEGFTADQMAAKAAELVPGFSAADYLDLTMKHPLKFTLAGLKAGTRLEGLLFPATYDFPPLKTARDLVELQLQTFRKTMAQVDLRRAAKAHLTVYDVVTIASVIEREVSVPSERALVAAVIWNRLRVGMPLQIDSVVAYGLHLPGASLTAADFAIDTPYNVYLHRGLPPTPISNPGLAALRAAADPAHVSYLYFVDRGDRSGPHYFADTYQQFLKDKAKAGF